MWINGNRRRQARNQISSRRRIYGGSSKMSKHHRLALLCTFVVVSVIVAATPAFAADANNGERLAHRWCAACHVVSAAQRQSTTDQAPPFATIAKIPGFDAAKIALFLLDPHPKMPDMGLSRTEAADLAAYIASLK
jgi:mono/diheme cytochrome c family protein